MSLLLLTLYKVVSNNLQAKDWCWQQISKISLKLFSESGKELKLNAITSLKSCKLIVKGCRRPIKKERHHISVTYKKNYDMLEYIVKS